MLIFLGQRMPAPVRYVQTSNRPAIVYVQAHRSEDIDQIPFHQFPNRYGDSW